MSNIFKILSPSQWEEFQLSGYFKGTEIDIADGYIHSAYADQCEHVLNRFFKNVRPLVLVEIHPELLLDSTVKLEVDETSGISYPHIYGGVPLTAAVSHKVLES
jgi:uncharacterized protein (DUF952 family)